MLNSWLDRLLVLLGITTLVLTLFALQYVVQGPPPALQSAPPKAPQAPDPMSDRTLDPGYGFARSGTNALQAGDASAAIRWFERATQASPDNAEWRRGLADAYRLNGDSLRASEEGLRALELDAPQAQEPAGD